jgi:hypothetical protein
MRIKSRVINLGNRSELARSWRSDAGRDRILIEQRHRHIFGIVQFRIVQRSSRYDHLNRGADGDRGHRL